MTPEGDFKRKLIAQIERDYPGAVIFKLDANRIQGVPDHIILYGPNWAIFEAKRARSASHRPNQDYYVDILNKMSLAQFVYPENKETFLNGLQQTFRPRRSTRIFKP